MAPRRVLVLTPDFPPEPGGIQVLSARIAEGLRAPRVEVVTIAHEDSGAYDESSSLEISRAGLARAPHRLNVLALNARGLAAAVRFRPDVVLSLHLVCAPVALLVRHALRKPYVQYVYADEMGASPFTRLALGSASRVIAISSHSRDLAVRAGAAPANVALIHPGVDGGTPPPRRAPEPTVVTVAGTDFRYKGHDVMLRAMPLIRRRIPDARWAVVGGGGLLPEYEAIARHLDLSSCVTFCGRVSAAERDRWFETAHVFAMPSRASAHGGGEGFGIAYLEAGSFGLPVVAGNVGGAVDAVVDGETGLLVDPEDHVAVAMAVSDLLADEALRDRLGAEGARRAAEFRWATVASRVDDVLQTVAEAA